MSKLHFKERFSKINEYETPLAWGFFGSWDQTKFLWCWIGLMAKCYLLQWHHSSSKMWHFIKNFDGLTLNSFYNSDFEKRNESAVQTSWKLLLEGAVPQSKFDTEMTTWNVFWYYHEISLVLLMKDKQMSNYSFIIWKYQIILQDW